MELKRWKPAGSVAIKSKLCSAVVYISGKPDRLIAVGYRGKQSNPAFNYRFREAANREKYIAKFFADVAASENAKIARKAEKKAALAKPHDLKLGDVLYASWGYDQTNIDFYQVVALKGVRSIEIRKIASESGGEDGFMTGLVVPVVGKFIGEPMLKKVDEYNGVRIASYACAKKLDPIMVDGKPVGYKPLRESWYA